MSEEHIPQRAQEPAKGAPVFETKQGMWSRGSGDTSGYGGLVREISMPGIPTPPFDDADADEIYRRAVDALPEAEQFPMLYHNGELTIYVPREQLTKVARTFRDDPWLRFEVIMSVSGVHYPQQTGAELHAVYHLLSYTHNRRVRLEVSCPDGDPHIPSVCATYPMADYDERETWDMFGIIFDGHPGLTRILMPDDWEGHPQRKDYPLGGIDVEYKGAKVPAPDMRRSYS